MVVTRAQLAGPVAVAVGDLVLHDPGVPGPVLVEVLPCAGGIDEPLPGRPLIWGLTRTDR
jgi:hypothetical protein